MKDSVRQALQIRYVKLRFCLVFTEDTALPKHKVSALRGGMGEMLLQTDCIKDKDCSACGFKKECIVQRIMYSPFDIKPDFVTEGESAGYVIECDNYREQFQSGETLYFNMLLYGKTIVYLNQILQAFYLLGQTGLGKEQARFVVESVRNSKNEILMEANTVYKDRYQVMTVGDYVEYRKRNTGTWSRIRVTTPMTVKFQGEQMEYFREDAFMAAVLRRIYMLACFENMETEKFYYRDFPLVFQGQKSHPVSIRRYSTTHKQGIWMTGIAGEIEMEEPTDEDTLSMLLAGEILHIGKNTSFGFGKYQIVE